MQGFAQDAESVRRILTEEYYLGKVAAAGMLEGPVGARGTRKAKAGDGVKYTVVFMKSIGMWKTNDRTFHDTGILRGFIPMGRGSPPLAVVTWGGETNAILSRNIDLAWEASNAPSNRGEEPDQRRFYEKPTAGIVGQPDPRAEAFAQRWGDRKREEAARLQAETMAAARPVALPTGVRSYAEVVKTEATDPAPMFSPVLNAWATPGGEGGPLLAKVANAPGQGVIAPVSTGPRTIAGPRVIQTRRGPRCFGIRWFTCSTVCGLPAPRRPSKTCAR